MLKEPVWSEPVSSMYDLLYHKERWSHLHQEIMRFITRSDITNVDFDDWSRSYLPGWFTLFHSEDLRYLCLRFPTKTIKIQIILKSGNLAPEFELAPLS